MGICEQSGKAVGRYQNQTSVDKLGGGPMFGHFVIT